MNDNQILLLGLGLEAPWKLVDQRLDARKQPHELHLTIQADRGRDTLALSAAPCARPTTSRRSSGGT